MKYEKIIDKIKKLFALSANNPNIHEAEMAMKAAKKMLDKHSLSMFDLNEKEDVSVTIRGEINMPWVRTLFLAISELYDCEYIISSRFGKKKRHVLIGTESNRVTAGIVLDYLVEAIRIESYGMGNAYRNGAALGVYHTVDEVIKSRKADKAEVIPGTGLVLADISALAQADNQAYMDANMNVKKSKNQNKQAFSDKGYAFGKTLNVGVRLSSKKAIDSM